MAEATQAGSRAEQISSALDEAISALTVFDADKLEALERWMSDSVSDGQAEKWLGAGHGTMDLREIRARHSLLGNLLASTRLNLKVLECLPGRAGAARQGDSPWGL